MKKIFQSTKNFFRMAKAIPQNSTIRTIVETVASNNVPEEIAVVEEVVEAPKPKAPRKKKVKEEAPKVEKVTKKTKKKDA